MKEIYGNYILAFLDVLGQQNLLKEIKRIPSTENERKLFNETIKKTYGVIENLKSTFDKFYNSYSKSDDIFSKIRMSHQPVVKYQRFSDCMILYHPIFGSTDNIPIQGIYSLISSCGWLLANSLSMGYSLRGCIDLGTGMEISENEFYGPVLSSAYNIESHIAEYPRIIIGDELLKYIKLSSEIHECSDAISILTKKIATICLSLIRKDYDDSYIIDYLGSGFNEYIWKNYNREKIISKISIFINANLDEFKKIKDKKLFNRYCRLKDYFEKSTSI